MDPSGYLSDISTFLDEKLETTHYQCARNPYRGVNWSYYHTQKEIMIEWMNQRIYRFEKQEQSGFYHQKYRNLYKNEQKSAEAVLRNTSLFLNPGFKFNFTGHFNSVKHCFQIDQTLYKGQRFEKLFTAQVLPSKSIVFIITVSQLPTAIQEKGSLDVKLAKYEYHQTIVFLDVIQNTQRDYMLKNKDAKEYSKVLQEYMKEPAYALDHNSLVPTGCISSNCFSIQETEYKCNIGLDLLPPTDEVSSLAIDNPFYDQVQKFNQNTFSDHKLQVQDCDKYSWNSQRERWIIADKALLEQINSRNQFVEEVSSKVISKCLDFGSAEKLVNILQNIPNFKVKLSSEQAHIIGSSGNVVCIGRSGTGKTTSAVLRMFALEMLFKYRLAVYRQRHSVNTNKRVSQKDLEKNTGIRCLFVTASPVLTNEIKRYYERLTKQLKEELVKRDEKVHAAELEKLVSSNLEAEVESKRQKQNLLVEDDYENDKNLVEQMMENDFNSLDLSKKLGQNTQGNEKSLEENKSNDKEEEDFFEQDDEEALQKDMDKFENLSSMDPRDFPAFMTIRNLIMLVDASLKFPFFKRNSEGRIRGQTVQNTWHNEQKGILYINNFHKGKAGPSKSSEFDIMEHNSDESDEEQDDQNISEFAVSAKYHASLEKNRQRIKQITSEKTKQTSRSKKMAYEVDFDYFNRFFWKRIQQKLIGFSRLDPHLVWTEIYSNIKGSGKSCHSWVGSFNGISKPVYLEDQNRFTVAEVDKLYEIFQAYETWKLEEGCYDFMDIVNYIIRALNYGINRNVTLLHYIMVDEVQDLPMNVLYLMKSLVTHGIFYSGDTAQTIAQGVGFRYGNLKQLFSNDANNSNQSMNFITQNFTVQQLTINFRSHNRILYLANSIIDLIEFFFPETIDRLKKERSTIDGPKPIILGESDPELLFCILSGNSDIKSARHSSNEGAMGRNPIEFGCSQVVLVRNQESKKNLPAMLSHALCLTIYEAKGLEFDDVILYNFFQDSSMDSAKWSLLRYMTYQSSFMDKLEFQNMLREQEKERERKIVQIHEMRQQLIADEYIDRAEQQKIQYMRIDEIRQQKEYSLQQRIQQRSLKMEQLKVIESSTTSDAVYCIERPNQDLIEVVTLKLNENSLKQSNVSGKDFSQLCLELKQLYVAVTRPKNRIIIYDENAIGRTFMQEYWEKLGCVEVITNDVLEGLAQQKNVAASGVNISAALSRKSDSEQWKQQGLRMMKLKYYQQAMLCFEHAKLDNYRQQARMFYLAEHAKEALEEGQREQLFLDEGLIEYAQLNKQEKSDKQRQISTKIRDARKEFYEVGLIFLEQEKYKQAAKCFFSSLSYEKAAEAYLLNGNKQSAAECYYIMKSFEKAGQLFLEINEFNKAIECYDFMEDWGMILEIIDKMKSRMSFKQREAYIKRYAPLALEELVSNIGMSSIEKSIQDQRKKNKVIDLIQKDQIIEEKEEDDDEQNSTLKPDPIVEMQNEDNHLNKEEVPIEETKPTSSEADQEQNKSESSASVSLIDFSAVEQSQSIQEAVSEVSVIMGQKKDEKSKHDDTSFINNLTLGDIEQEDSKSVDPNMSFDIVRTPSLVSDFDHLSEIDPEDEWLKSETGSIVEIINRSRESGIFSSSEFSSLSFVEITSTSLIKTNADIFIQDEIMRKVIHYMSMFSENFKSEIKKIKSKDALLSSRIEQNDQSVLDSDASDMLVDLDNIDFPFLYLILDTLEHYNIFRLAIFVCNRYKLSRKAGRYLVSIAHKFSPNSQENMSFNKLLIQMSEQKQRQMEKSIIANIALHNLFEVISPEFLRLKEQEEIVSESNSLGIEVFRGLLMLGFWKKILFIMDYERSLSLAQFFGDYINFKTIFITKNRKYKNKVKCIEALRKTEPDFECIPFESTPNDDLELEMAIISLEHVNSYQSMKSKFSKYSQKNKAYAKKLEQECDSVYETIPQFPPYFQYTGQFWKYFNSKAKTNFCLEKHFDSVFFSFATTVFEEAKQILSNSQNILENKVQIFDVFSFIGCLFSMLQNEKIQVLLINSLDNNGYLAMGQVSERIIGLFDSMLALTQIDLLILRCLLSPLQTNLNIRSSDLLDAFGQLRACIHKTSRFINNIQQSEHDEDNKHNFSINISIPQFKDFCALKYGGMKKKITDQQKKEYQELCDDKKNTLNKIELFKKTGNIKTLDELIIQCKNHEDLQNVKQIRKIVEQDSLMKQSRFQFLDVDCDYISAPLSDILIFLKKDIYNIMISLISRRIVQNFSKSKISHMSAENIFVHCAQNLALNQVILNLDKAHKTNDGYKIINKNVEGVVPEYKKLKKTNPLYRLYKLDYMKKINEKHFAEEEEDEDIQNFFKFEGIRQKKRKTQKQYSISERCKKQFDLNLKETYRGKWVVNLDLFVRNIITDYALKSISTFKVESIFNLKKFEKYANLLAILDLPSYLYNIKVVKNLKNKLLIQFSLNLIAWLNFNQKDTQKIIENIFMLKNGVIQKPINNILDIQDRHFLELGVEEKLKGLEYCLIWGTIAYLASTSDTFSLYISQSSLKLLPPLMFSDFTTDETSDNPFNSPSKFTVDISIEPISSQQILVDILSFLSDLIKKQSDLMVKRSFVCKKIISLIFLVLFNLKKISDDLADEALSIFEIFDQEIHEYKWLDSLEFWEDLVTSRDTTDLEELIPSFVHKRRLAIATQGEDSEPIHEVIFDNSKNSLIVKGSRAREIKQQLLQSESICAIKRSSSVIISQGISYNMHEMQKSLKRLTSSQSKVILISMFNNSKHISTQKLLELNFRNSQVFSFFQANEDFIKMILFNVVTKSVRDPLDFHYLMLLNEQSARKKAEFEELLGQLIEGKESTIINTKIQKLTQEIVQKAWDFSNWAKIQFSKAPTADIGQIFLLNKMSIAIKWAKVGQYKDARSLVQDINSDLSMKEANSFKLPLNNDAQQIGNRFKSNQPKTN